MLVCAEPGDPHLREHHDVVTTEVSYLESAYAYAYRCFKEETDPYHKRIVSGWRTPPVGAGSGRA